MPKQTDKELGLFFKNARHEQKLTYEELAEKAEMSSRYLKEIENGGRVPSFHKIRKLVRALNVPPEPLFYPNNHTDINAAAFPPLLSRYAISCPPVRGCMPFLLPPIRID